MPLESKYVGRSDERKPQASLKEEGEPAGDIR